MVTRDTIFAEKNFPPGTFQFNEKVASVFDDMIKRSVPLYMESIKQQSLMAQRFYKPGTRIYDLGCSHGNLGILIRDIFTSPCTMVAVDNSPHMLNQYKKRLKREDMKKGSLHLVCSNAEDMVISRASVVIVNLTMQFIKPQKRDGFIQGIYDGMIPGGVLLISEKTVHHENVISDLHQDFYTEFKRSNGYSDLEISRKRDALENILIPESMDAHMARLRMAGFRQIDIWLKWFNFTSFIAVKSRSQASCKNKNTIGS
ncbi:MAG: carboxy-S-adenosyl-L-methionine synthase CmoA [Desulfamplus sp.]|nr:carboxy-S-adenosyl-L-methionine synthase CmoA [Desulfamplus sp.]